MVFLSNQTIYIPTIRVLCFVSGQAAPDFEEFVFWRIFNFEYEFRISWYVMKYTLVCLNRMFARIATARVIAFSRSKHIDTTLMSLAGLIDLINRLIVWLIDYIRWISLFVV